MALQELEESSCQALRAAAWDVHIITGLHRANRLLHEQHFPVGIIAATDVGAAQSAEIDAFVRQHRSLEWVGVFDARSLESPHCRDLILDHFFDHHTLPVDAPRLLSTLGHAYGHGALRQAAESLHSQREQALIIGRSPATVELLRQIRRVAKVDAPVFIGGESGSGKELAAQAVHQYSARANQPFVPVNCGAIQPSLIQSELFGYEKGAFTGASREKRGLIEAAKGGTLFLDEVGELPRELQVNLLRFLQEKTINRVGSTRSIEVDARVIAATNIELEKAVAAGRFREDIFYRLNVLSLHVAPLRERGDDIVLLAEHFFKRFELEKSPRLKGFSERALAALMAHPWPGNVRELLNRVRRAAVMSEGRLITPADLGLQQSRPAYPWEALGDARTKAEQMAIATSLSNAGRNITVAARQLGVSRMTLYRLMSKHGIS